MKREKKDPRNNKQNRKKTENKTKKKWSDEMKPLNQVKGKGNKTKRTSEHRGRSVNIGEGGSKTLRGNLIKDSMPWWSRLWFEWRSIKKPNGKVLLKGIEASTKRLKGLQRLWKESRTSEVLRRGLWRLWMAERVCSRWKDDRLWLWREGLCWWWKDSSRKEWQACKVLSRDCGGSEQAVNGGSSLLEV